MGDNVGLLPDAQAAKQGDPAVASGASVAFSISSKTKHPNEAAAFLDFMRSPEAATGPVRQRVHAGRHHSADLKATRRDRRHRHEFAKLVADNGIVPFPDFASPNMIDRLTLGRAGPAEQADDTGRSSSTSLQESWTQHHE